jgi:hypothetical protein
MYICIYIYKYRRHISYIQKQTHQPYYGRQRAMYVVDPESHLAAMSCPAKFTDLATAGIDLPAHMGPLKSIRYGDDMGVSELGVYPPVMAI